MGQVDGLDLPVQPILRQPRWFEIGVPGVQYQRMHDRAGHQLDDPGVLLARAGGLLEHLGRRRAVVVFYRGHWERIGLLLVVLVLVPCPWHPVGRGQATESVVHGGLQWPLVGVWRRTVVVGDGWPRAMQQFNGWGVVVDCFCGWSRRSLHKAICGEKKSPQNTDCLYCDQGVGPTADSLQMFFICVTYRCPEKYCINADSYYFYTEWK